MADEVIIRIPRKIVEHAIKLGIDLESSFLEYIQSKLTLDPRDEIELHVNLAEHLFQEGSRLVERDPVQASEKLYKVAEECLKALAIYFNFDDILKVVKERGRWTVKELDECARRISDILGTWFYDAWDHAWVLHVWGFHEAKLDIEGVKKRMKYVEKILEETKRLIKNLLS